MRELQLVWVRPIETLFELFELFFKTFEATEKVGELVPNFDAFSSLNHGHLEGISQILPYCIEPPHFPWGHNGCLAG